MDKSPIDNEYEAKMAGFEIDCNQGTGVAEACHHVGEFYATVKSEYERAAKVYEKNCIEKTYGPSCLNLARLYCKNCSIFTFNALPSQYHLTHYFS
jgi:hypothetical protein